MKIAFVNRYFLDYRISVIEELDVLSEHELCLFCSGNAIPSRITAELKRTLQDRCFVFGGEIGHGVDTPVAVNFSNQSLRIPFQPGLLRELRKMKPDIVISEGFFQWTWMAALYCIVARTNLVLTYERTEHTERKAQWYRKFYRRCISRIVSGYAINGSQTLKYLNTLGIESVPITTGQMAADNTKMQDASASISAKKIERVRSSLGIENDARVFFSASQIIERKGLRQMIDAWDKYMCKNRNQDMLVIAGDGPLLSELRSLVDSKPIQNVRLIGRIEYSDMPLYYAMSDVFVIPTLEDNWSLVVPEAMACGLPVITTIYNGCHPELIHPGKSGLTSTPQITNCATPTF